MKAILLSVAFLAFATAPLRAQVTVELRLEQNQFLRNETLPVKMRITNRSGRPLKIGETSDWLSFTVQDHNGKVVPPVQEVVAGGKFELDSASSVTKVIDLSPGYDFSQPGKYRVSAVAQFPDLKLSVSSDPEPFDIIRGAHLWQEVCGVDTPGGTPHYIRYSLLQAFQLQQLRIYVRVSDEPEANFARVIPLGGIVSFAKPEQIIDRSSILHALYQSGPRSFDYWQITPRGEVAQQKAYDLGSTRPRLKMSEDGHVEVVGGVPRSAPSVATGAAADTNGTNLNKRPN